MAMNVEQLNAIQGPLKERCKAEPESALITLRATGGRWPVCPARLKPNGRWSRPVFIRRRGAMDR